jgi:hypothetical protein
VLLLPLGRLGYGHLFKSDEADQTAMAEIEARLLR